MISDKPLSTSRKKKFLFDQHIFDEPEVGEGESQEDAPPPPPTFSEEELEAAKSSAFEEGRQAGIKESTESREQNTARLLEVITKEVQALFESENAREKLFEKEVLDLTNAVFSKVFPLYEQKYGFDELKDILSQVIQNQQGQTQIQIEVSPSQKEGIQNYINKISLSDLKESVFTVLENESITEGTCKLSWKDGGAVRNSTNMANEIHQILQDTLAGADIKRHDEESEQLSADQESQSGEEENKPKSRKQEMDIDHDD